MKKVLDVFKKPLWLLCLGLGIVLFASIFANMANTSAYQVSVTEVKMETSDNSTLVALRYANKKCSEAKKCPVIITTHGYLNSKEMQDEAAIELSKRGYIVYALDMYDHGDSVTETTSAFSFWITSQWDAVNWVYDNEKALLKASDETGMIAVAGHSMGGFSSRMAAYFDNLSVSYAGAPQKVVAVLAMGADYKWMDTFHSMAALYNTIPSGEQAIAAVGNRTYGTLAARYDEFFFLDPTGTITVKDGDNVLGTARTYGNNNTVVEKDWGKTQYGKATYYGISFDSAKNEKDVESGVWNDDIAGGRVIYMPNEIHPWDHFSIESTAYQIDFYNHAFKNQFEIHNVATDFDLNEGKAQSWWLKEGFECIGLIGMFIAIIASIALFAELPFFNKVKTEESAINEVAEPSRVRKCLFTIFACVTTFALAYLYPMIILGTTATWYTNVLTWIMRVGALVTVVLLIVRVVLRAIGKENEDSKKVITEAILGALAITVAALFAYWTLSKNFFSNSNYFNEPGTNEIVQWAFACSGITLLSLVIAHVFSNRKDGFTWANYGLKANWKQVLMSLLIAVITVCGVYVLTFAIEALLRVDFRVWTYAIKPFGWNHFLAFLKYLPFYFAFYFMNAVAVVANTGRDKSWKGTLKAILLNCLGVVFVLAIHYGKDFVTGQAHWPTLALDILLLFAVVPTLAFAAWFTRKSYFKTGNIWTAVFISTLLFTLMQVANTTLYLFN